MTNFHQSFKELRIEKGLSQQVVAESLGVNQRTVSSWEVSRVEPDFSMLVKIAKFFEVTTDYLLGNEN
ncbi:MAG: helix-turn-helix domain-containing protein [Clostridia bacterium]|nr:helix-turn-helix domain-containing protein [Clostridia bacterium]